MDELLRFDKTKTLLFIDFETENLNLNFQYNVPWQVAMIEVRGDEVLSSYKNFIKWDRPLHVGQRAAEITRYNPEQVAAEGVCYSTVIDDIVSKTQSANFIVGHNVLNFDIYFLSQMYQLRQRPWMGLATKIIDTNGLAKGIKLGMPYDRNKWSLVEYLYRMIHTKAKGVKTRLEVLGPEYEIQHDYANLHNALVDLELNVKIWHRQKFEVEL